MVEVDWDIVKARVKELGIWTYWIVGIIIVTTISYVLYTKFNKQIAALLVFMASLLALYYYYVKWFVIGTDFTPPISFCPDFMTNLGPLPANIRADGDKVQFVCVDTIGIVSDNKFTSVSSSAQANLNAFSSITKQSAEGDVNPLGNGTPNIGYGYVITPNADRVKINNGTFCGKLKTAGLSWIGVCS